MRARTDRCPGWISIPVMNRANWTAPRKKGTLCFASQCATRWKSRHETGIGQRHFEPARCSRVHGERRLKIFSYFTECSGHVDLLMQMCTAVSFSLHIPHCALIDHSLSHPGGTPPSEPPRDDDSIWFRASSISSCTCFICSSISLASIRPSNLPEAAAPPNASEQHRVQLQFAQANFRVRELAPPLLQRASHISRCKSPNAHSMWGVRQHQSSRRFPAKVPVLYPERFDLLRL